MASNIRTTHFGDTYLRRLFHEMHQQYVNGQLYDFTIKTSGQDIHCHRLMLAGAFPYFTAMFEMANLLGHNETSADLSFLDAEAMQKLVELAYTGKISFSVDDIKPLVKAAGYLQAEEVMQECDDFLLSTVNHHNCTKWYVFSSQYNLQKVVAKCQALMLQYFRDVIHCDDFKQMHVQNVIELLCNDSLNIPSEQLVFDAILLWISHAPDDRSVTINSLLECVRLNHCTTSLLMSLIEDSKYNPISTMKFRNRVRNVLRHRTGSRRRSHLTICHQPRFSFTTNKLLVIGGQAAEDELKVSCVRDCMYWQRTEQQWQKFTELPSHYAACHQWNVCATDGRIFVTGGRHKDDTTGVMHGCSDAWMWTRCKWTPLPLLNNGRWAHGTIFAANKLFCFGGKCRKESSHSIHLKCVEFLNLESVPDQDSPVIPPAAAATALSTTAQWHYTSSMKFKFYAPLLCVLGEFIYVLGMMGWPDRIVDQVYEYSIPKHSFTPRAPMPVAAKGGAAVAIGEDIYVVGGMQAMCLRYQPATDTWTSLAATSLGHHMSGAVYLDGKIMLLKCMRKKPHCCAGGVEEYDIKHDEWNSSNMKLPAMYDGAVVALWNVEMDV